MTQVRGAEAAEAAEVLGQKGVRQSMPSGLDWSEGWAADPEKPIRYGLFQMIADCYHGWQDGRRNIPQVDTEPAEPAMSHVPDPGANGSPQPGGRLPKLPVETPRLKSLCRVGGLQIAQEWITHQREAAILTQWFAASVTRAGTLARLVEQSADRLDAAGKPPEAGWLDERRLAESDHATRPASLVRARRENDHERRLRAAQTAHLDVERRFAEALLESLVLGDLVQRRTEVTEIRVNRIHDHTWRRIAVYWQRLIRVHDQGPAVNARLAPLGPKLPPWVKDDFDQDHLDARSTPR